MILWHRLQQIFVRSAANFSEDVPLDESRISADNNQYIFLLHNFAVSIGRMGGNTMKKMTSWKHFLDKNNLMLRLSCNIPCLNIFIINVDSG